MIRDIKCGVVDPHGSRQPQRHLADPLPISGNVRDADRDARVVCGDVAGSVLTSVVAPAFLAPRVQTAPSPDPRMKPPDLLTRENTVKVFADRGSPLAKARGVIDTGAAS